MLLSDLVGVSGVVPLVKLSEPFRSVFTVVEGVGSLLPRSAIAFLPSPITEGDGATDGDVSLVEHCVFVDSG